MANLKETSRWEEGIYQFEQTDWLSAGEDGLDNVPLRQLANRTVFLKDNLGNLKQEMEVFTKKLETQFSKLKAEADAKIKEAIEYSKGILPVGTVMSYPVFKGKTFGQWHICDGSTFDAVKYKELFYVLGVKKLPKLTDKRLFIRSCGANGEDIGTIQEDMFKSHSHSYYAGYYGKATVGASSSTSELRGYTSSNTGSTGGDETRPKNISMAFYIKMI